MAERGQSPSPSPSEQDFLSGMNPILGGDKNELGRRRQKVQIDALDTPPTRDSPDSDEDGSAGGPGQNRYVRLREEHVEAVVILRNSIKREDLKGINDVESLWSSNGKLTFNLTPEQLGGGGLGFGPGEEDKPSLARKSSLRRNSLYSNQLDLEKRLLMELPKPVPELGGMYDVPQKILMPMFCEHQDWMDMNSFQDKNRQPKFDEILTVYDQFPTDFLPSKYICGICGRLCQEPRVLDCLHSFCKRCLIELEANAHSGSNLFWRRINESGNDGCGDSGGGGSFEWDAGNNGTITMPKVEKARNTLSVETKKARNKIPVETKINILDALKKGMKRNEVAEEFGVPYSTVRTIESLEAKIRQTYANGTSESSRISSYIRDPVIEKTEKCLSIFIEDCAQKKIPLSGDLVKEKAGQIYELVLRDASTPSTEDTHRFKASTGWLYGFLHRYSLHNVRTKGESASADTEAAEKFLPVFMKEVEEGGYLPDQVFDCDESGVWWKKMPDRTFVPKSQTSAAGFKAAKDKITILLCSNASGDKLMKPLLINKSARPRSMQKVDFNKLPVFWRHNSKAWMTRVIFTDWFETCFVPEVKSYLQEKGLPFRVLLLLDNASSHTLIDHPNIKMMFLPPNTTSILQPLDMGIIATFKKLYVKQAFRFILDMIEADPKLKLTEAWKNFTIYDCVRFVGSAAQAVKKSTLNGCWRPLWPGVVRDKKEMSSDLDTHIVRLGDKLVPGFDQADLEEMLKENPMSDEELMDMIEGDKAMETEEDHLTQSQGSTLSRDVVVKGLEMADDLANFFVDNDPYLERAVAFKKELNDLVKRYADLTSNSSDDTTSQLQPTNGHDDDLAQPGPSKVELSYHSDEDNSELRLLYESDSE